MADHTRFTDLQEAQKQLDHVVKSGAFKRAVSKQKLHDQISVASMAEVTRVKDLQAAQKQLDKVLQSASTKRAAAELKVQEQFAGAFSQTPGGHVHGKELDLKIGSPSKYAPSPLPRIDFPRFDGSNPRAWMFKCNSFFKLMPNIHDAQRIHLASMHFDGRALAWFQDLNMVELGITWKQFLEVVSARFEMLPISHIIMEFNELKQNGSYDDYVERFEELMAYILLHDSSRYSEEYLIAHFMSGLSEELQSFLHMSQPRTLADTIELGRKQLTTLDAIARKLKSPSRVFLGLYNTYKRIEPVPLLTPVPVELQPTKLLTSSEMAARIEKGLCSNCDEHFISGHRCKKRINYVLMTEEEELLEAQETTKLVNQDAACFHLKEAISSAQMLALPNFSEPFILETDARRKEICTVLRQNQRPIQGQEFQYSPRLLKIEGSDLNLGGDWLKFCSPIDLDYMNMYFSVFLNGKKVKLKALTTTAAKTLSTRSIFCSSVHQQIHEIEENGVLKITLEKATLKGARVKLQALTSVVAGKEVVLVLKSLDDGAAGALMPGTHAGAGGINRVLQGFTDEGLVFFAAATAASSCCKKNIFVQKWYAICKVVNCFHRKFLTFDPWGQGSSLGGAIVMAIVKEKGKEVEVADGADLGKKVGEVIELEKNVGGWLISESAYAMSGDLDLSSRKLPSLDPRGRGSSAAGGIVMYCERFEEEGGAGLEGEWWKRF